MSGTSEHQPDPTVPRDLLSALSDGEASAAEAALVSAAWRRSPETRATWHSYQLIGDVLRSQDPSTSTQSAAFLQRLRERLADEPVVLAPHAATDTHDLPRQAAGQAQAVVAAPAVALRRRLWAGPAAVAASFAVLVGLMTNQLGPMLGGAPSGAGEGMTLSRQTVPGLGGPNLSLALDASSAMRVPVVPAVPVGDAAEQADASFNGRAEPTSGVLLRDPHLDRLLAAQRPLSPAPSSFDGQDDATRQVVFRAP